MRGLAHRAGLVSPGGRGPAVLGACALLALALAASGCRRARPSPDYANARAKLDALVAELGDDAYLDPAMEEVEKLLARVPEKSSDAPAAAELRRKLGEERARVERERAERAGAEQQPPDDPWANPPPAPAPEEEVVDAGEADAGYPFPITGMPVAEVRARFSACFLPSQPVRVGQDWHDTFELRDLPSCRDAFPRFRDQLVAARGGVVVGQLARAALRTVNEPVDGGVGR